MVANIRFRTPKGPVNIIILDDIMEATKMATVTESQVIALRNHHCPMCDPIARGSCLDPKLNKDLKVRARNALAEQNKKIERRLRRASGGKLK